MAYTLYLNGVAQGPVPERVAAPKVAPEEKARRLALCMACEHIDPEKKKCRLCNCRVSIRTGWVARGCPLTPPKW
jgi:hypothetical protein